MSHYSTLGGQYNTAIVPFGGYTDPTVRWYSSELVYSITNGLPSVTNYGRPSYTVPSVYNNKVSGGGGGGAGAQVKAIFVNTSFYNVIPGNSYTVIVGDGGAGGTADTNIENAGAKGGDSTFDTITSEGGSGGQPSRTLTNNTDGYNNGGKGQTTKNYLLGGYGGQGVGGAGGGGDSINGGYGGAQSFAGFMGQGVAFSGGGAGGAPDTVASGTTTPNIGKGGAGTGATLNSFASGIKGGTGLVKLHYFI